MSCHSRKYIYIYIYIYNIHVVCIYIYINYIIIIAFVFYYRLKNQFKSQEEDRNFLIKQLVAVKKDNSRLRAEYNAVDARNNTLQEEVL